MQYEMMALQSNDTWSLVTRPNHSNVVGSKWVFRTKYNFNGAIERQKVCIVAQGFT